MRLEVDKLKKTPLNEKINFFKETLDSDIHYSVKEAVISQIQNEKYENKKNYY